MWGRGLVAGAHLAIGPGVAAGLLVEDELAILVRLGEIPLPGPADKGLGPQTVMVSHHDVQGLVGRGVGPLGLGVEIGPRPV